MSRINQLTVPQILSQDQRAWSMMIYGDLISSADDDPMFLNWTKHGVSFIIHNWNNNLLWAKHYYHHDRKTTTRQVKRQAHAWTIFFFSYSNWIFHVEFIPEGAIVNKTRYKEIPVRWCDSIHHKYWAVATWQFPCILLCTCPIGTCKAAGDTFATSSIFTWSCNIWFFSFLAWNKSCVISFFWRGHDCHKKSHMGPSCQNFSAVLPAATAMLENVQNGQQWLFWGRM